MVPRVGFSGRPEIERSVPDDATGTAGCGTGVPHYSRSGDRRYTAAGAVQNEYGALQTDAVTLRGDFRGISQDNQCIKSNGATVDALRVWRYSRNTGFGTRLQHADA